MPQTARLRFHLLWTTLLHTVAIRTRLSPHVPTTTFEGNQPFEDTPRYGSVANGIRDVFAALVSLRECDELAVLEVFSVLTRQLA